MNLLVYSEQKNSIRAGFNKIHASTKTLNFFSGLILINHTTESYVKRQRSQTTSVTSEDRNQDPQPTQFASIKGYQSERSQFQHPSTTLFIKLHSTRTLSVPESEWSSKEGGAEERNDAQPSKQRWFRPFDSSDGRQTHSSFWRGWEFY